MVPFPVTPLVGQSLSHLDHSAPGMLDTLGVYERLPHDVHQSV